ncbi:MAG: hypothetical protein ACKV0T_13130 [Planctomycetales bacterium]
MTILCRTALALAVCCGLTVAAAAEERTATPRVLLIGKQPDHPHGSHMYLHT